MGKPEKEHSLSIQREQGIAPKKPLEYSWLPADVQLNLIREITEKVQRALQDPQAKHLYVSFSKTFYEGSINIPFAITAEEPQEWIGRIEVYGPFEAFLASALAYIEEESIILGSRHLSADAESQLKQTQNITSVEALGQTLSLFISHIHLYQKQNPTWSLDQVLEVVHRNNLERYRKEVADYQERYDTSQKTARPSSYLNPGPSHQYSNLREATDRLRGYEQGILLLSELLQFPWDIEVEPRSFVQSKKDLDTQSPFTAKVRQILRKWL